VGDYTVFDKLGDSIQFPRARNLTGRSHLSIWIYYLTRSLFNVLRSIEALLYVAIFFY